MTNEEIEKVEEAGIEVLEDVDGNVINLDENEELNSMGEGEDEKGEEDEE